MSIETLSIEDAIERLIDYRGKTPPKVASGVRLVTAKVIKEGRILDDPAEYIAPEFYDEWMRRGLPRADDVLLTTEAPLGEVAILGATKVALAQRVILLRAKGDRVLPRFLYYALQSDFAQAELRRRATGTTVAGIKQSELRQARIPWFPIETQHHIARVLSAYDESIETNLRRIRVLEEMARVLYHEWFVELRAPGVSVAIEVDVPAGWRFVRLGSIADVNRAQINTKTPPDRVLYIDISSVGPGIVREVSELAFAEAPGRARRIVQHGDILWSCVRPNRRSHALVLSPKPSTVASTGFAVLTATKVPFTFLYQATTTDAFVAYLANHATGAAYPAVTAKTFEDAEILVPPADLLERFAQVTTPMAELIANLQRQNLNLRATRDLLLPRLMSGQLSLADVNDLARTATTIEDTAAV